MRNAEMFRRFRDIMHEIPAVEEALRRHFESRRENVIGRAFAVRLPGVRMIHVFQTPSDSPSISPIQLSADLPGGIRADADELRRGISPPQL